MAIATAPADIEKLVKPGKLFIDGEFVDAESGETFETINPATGEVLTRVAHAGKADIDKAVRAARRAFESGPYAKMSARDRAGLLRKLAELIMDNHDELARLESLDNGKPIADSHTRDIPRAAQTLVYFAGWADKIEGSVIPVSGPFFNYTRREPVGVVGQIIPWNFPMVMLAKLAPAIACGCTVILKPAEQTPLTALRFAELCVEAGVPPGVINICPGYGETAGAALTEHPGVDKIAFTGEWKTGQIIMRACAGNLKRLSLELGGKSPNIVLDDADLASAVQGASRAAFYNAGQVCIAGTRLLVQKGIHKEFVQELTRTAESIKVGDPLDESTRQGPQISEEQFEKVLSYIEIGKSENAELACGGERVGDRGYFVQPTIFDNVDNAMRIAQEEIFGPVLATIEVKDVEEAIRIGNDTMYGLAAAVWTKDIAKAHRVAHGLRAGTVWINTYGVLEPGTPFGGYKFSGFGREGGKQVLDMYTETKSVWVNLA